ncbi:MAG: hypothetical protein U1E60_07420 [Reyranellaceae bacterium]
MTTTLTFHMSPQFLQEVTGSSTGSGGASTQGGVWAYLWNNQPPPDYVSPIAGASNNWTPLIANGSITSNVALGTDGNYDVTISLTDSSTPNGVSSGVIYLLLQSENPATHNNLVSLIGSSEGNIQPNVSNWNYGYSQFEFTLSNAPADQGDLTAIPGYGQHLAVNVSTIAGASRGYGVSGSTLEAALGSAAALKYPSSTTATPYSPLDGTVSMVISPSNGNFGSGYYPSSNWSQYLNAFATLTTTAGQVNISGMTNGEPDAAGIWHNSQYYSYNVQSLTLAAGSWGNAGTYFKFSPNANSQTQGYMLISQATLQDNLYAAGQGYATLWQDSALTIPYAIPGSAPGSNQFNPSANNEWGNIFTPLFTGFTAGYWGAQAQSSNPMDRAPASASNLGGGPVNLDNTIYQSSSYAFDLNRSNTIPTYQHNDAYSELFFNQSNVYGSAFSDNLSNGLTPGPLVPLATSSGDVSNIDLYVYSSTQPADPYYIKPVGANYVALPAGQQDYLVPTQTSNLQLIVTGLSAGTVLRSDATLKLGIYDGNGTFTYVPLTNTAGNIWQNYNIAGSSASGWTGASGGSNVTGTFIINNLPAPSTTPNGGVYWYQLVVSDTTGDQKVIDFYATSNGTVGQIQGTLSSMAADGQASVQYNNNPSQLQLNLNPQLSMPAGLLTFQYNSQFSPMPAAPVAGQILSGVFQANNAFAGQNGDGLATIGSITGTGNPTLTLTQAYDLQFGWTGLNNGNTNSGIGTGNGLPTTAQWISQYTNKIVAGDTAMIVFKNVATGETLPINNVSAVADLDGQWQTTTGVQIGSGGAQLGNGTYNVTMQEQTPTGADFGPASAPLVLTVNVATLAIGATLSGNGVQFATLGAGAPSGNFLHVDPVQVDHATLAQGADVLLYATNSQGQLLDRDGHTGSGLTIADATLARLGLMNADNGQNLLKFGNSLFLQTDEQLHFAILNKDGSINSNPSVVITPQSDGSLLTTVGGLQFITKADNTLSNTDYLADSQHDSNLPLFYLQHGAKLAIDVAGSAANVNLLAFVKIDIDSHGAMSVAGVAYGNTAEFRKAVSDHAETDFTVYDGGRTFATEKTWQVQGDSGYYAPVMVTQSGEILVIGNANADGKEHIRLMGANAFGVEDLLASRGSDFDYNDMLVGISKATG